MSHDVAWNLLTKWNKSVYNQTFRNIIYIQAIDIYIYLKWIWVAFGVVFGEIKKQKKYMMLYEIYCWSVKWNESVCGQTFRNAFKPVL